MSANSSLSSVNDQHSTINVQRLSLNGNWQFYLASSPEQAEQIEAERFYSNDYKADRFKTIKVPACWAIEGFEEPVYREFKTAPHTEGFYIHRFMVPKSMHKQRLLLHFGGVWNSAEIWLNGKWLGRHDSGYTSFSYDVSDELNAGKENLIAIRVRQVYPNYTCDTYDDWSLGGIYRDVSIESMPGKRWIDRVRVKTDLDDNYRDAKLTVKVMVGDKHKNTLPGNYMSPGKPYQLRITLSDALGNTVEKRTTAIKAHTSTSREHKEVIDVTQPNLWTAETPYLYTLLTELIESDGTVSHCRTERVGFREISTEGGVFRINGQAVKLRGVNRHDEHPDVGRSTTREHWLQDLQLMKQANINYIRTAHYQHARGFIEMCDSIGMYVGSEVSLGGAGMTMYDPGFIAGVQLRTVETVERDINSPSVIYWSVGNEDPLTDLHLMSVKTVKGLDPTRPVLLPWNEADVLPEDVDIIAPHYWTAAQYDSLAAKADRPIISTEYTHAYGEYRFGGLQDRWNALTKHKTGAGAAVWMWADQGIMTPTPRDEQKYGKIVKDNKYLRMSTDGWDGIVDSYRKPTRDFYELKAVYAPVRPDCETVSVAATTKSISLPIRNDYDFINLDNIKISWQLYSGGRLLDQDTCRISAAPHSVGNLNVSLAKINKAKEDEDTYLWLMFTNSDGNEIGRNSVELKLIGTTGKQSKENDNKIVENGEKVIVNSGSTTYVFNRNTGSVAEIAIKGKAMASDMRPTIWHKLNDGDHIIKNRNFASGVSLDKLSPSVKSFDVKENADCITIMSEVDYTVNDSNMISAHYIYRICGNGELTVDYTLTTDVQTTYLPIVGIQLKTSFEATLNRWFGLGPSDAYPNKQAATMLGVWDGAEMEGTHAMRWAELKNGQKTTLRITANGYIDRDSKTDKVLRFVPYVLGRSEKGRLNEQHYQLKGDGTYKGKLIIKQK